MRVKRSTRILAGLLLAAVALPAAGYGSGKLAAGALTASAITQRSAVLSGIVSTESGKEPATWLIRYGTSATTLDQATPAQRVPVGSARAEITVTAALSDLPAATQLHARLEVTQEDDVERGAVTSFTTAGAPAPATPQPGATPAPGETPPSSPPPAAPPELGEQVGAAPRDGTVRVRLPGSDAFVELAEGASLPVGSVVDATQGEITLTAALPGGAVQHAVFGGARFKIRQPDGARGRVDLLLRGGDFAACGARTLAAVTGSKKPRAVRRLWGKDRSGRFRTHGRDSVTTVRGTEWSVADRCDGTVTRVTEGAVDVRVRRTGRVVRLRAGERHLARHRR